MNPVGWLEHKMDRTRETYAKTHRVGQSLMSLTASAVIAFSPVRAQEQHFHPKGKPPSKFTIESQTDLRATLPFAEERDFEESNLGGAWSVVLLDRPSDDPLKDR
jgi:hypothetical protein